jgi:hypothetical protein
VEITVTLTEQLQHLVSGDPGRGERLAAGLNRLRADLTQAVPSLLAVSIRLVRVGGGITLSTLARAAGSTPVRASLAVPLSTTEPGDLLVLRAGEPGVFLLLADDLAGLLGPGHPPLQVDRHLGWPPAPTGAALAASLADLDAVNQGIGVLLDRGFPPEAAWREVQRRADDADLTIGVASRLLPEVLPPRDEPR